VHAVLSVVRVTQTLGPPFSVMHQPCSRVIYLLYDVP
jgi:hypothetical protein